MAETPFPIGPLLFPDISQRDLTGPYAVLTRLPDAEVRLVWKTRDPVTAGGGVRPIPDTTFADCPPPDLICGPGGAG